MAVALGVLAARQVYQETHDFAVSSMDGDAGNEVAMRLAVSRLFAELGDFAVPHRETSDELSSMASYVLKDVDASGREKRLAACLSGQDETAGPRARHG